MQPLFCKFTGFFQLMFQHQQRLVACYVNLMFFQKRIEVALH